MSPVISHTLIFAFLSLVAAIQPSKHQPHFKTSHYTLSSHNKPLFKNLNALSQNIKTLSHPLNPLADVTETVPRTQINLLTYNLYLRPPTIQDDEHDDYKDQRLEEFIKLLPNYDIICFEEVFGIMSKRKNKLIESGKLAGFLYNMSAPAPSPGFITDGALLILSRFPIVASDFQAFPKGEGIEGFVEKGVLYAKIQVKDDILHLFHTHQFANSGGVNALGKRGEGFVAWRDFMKQCFKEYKYREGEVCLLVGDFNVNGNGAKMTASELTGHPVLNLYPNLTENGTIISEYEAMIAILGGNNSDSIEDILYKKNGEHPATMSGSIYEEGNGPAFDYIFRFTPEGILEDGEEQESEEEVEKGGQINVLEDSVKVEKFNVTDKPFKLLSDHYGVSVALEYAEK